MTEDDGENRRLPLRRPFLISCMGNLQQKNIAFYQQSVENTKFHFCVRSPSLYWEVSQRSFLPVVWYCSSSQTVLKIQCPLLVFFAFAIIPDGIFNLLSCCMYKFHFQLCPGAYISCSPRFKLSKSVLIILYVYWYVRNKMYWYYEAIHPLVLVFFSLYP